MDSLKRLLEQKKPTNNYKPAEPESSTKSHVNTYQKDLGLIDSPLEKRGALAGTIQKSMLTDRRIANLPTVGQLKAQSYYNRRPTQNPQAGGQVQTEEGQNGHNSSSNPEIGTGSQSGGPGGHARMEEQYRIPDPTSGDEVRMEEEDTVPDTGTGQPPAKIANPRGQSGSSGVYRTTIGKSELWENRPQHQGESIEAILQNTQDPVVEVHTEGGTEKIPRGALTYVATHNVERRKVNESSLIKSSVPIRRDLRNVSCETCGRRYLAGDNNTACPYCAKSASKPGMSHTVIDSKWENQDEIGLGNVTRPQVEGRDKVTPRFAYTEFVELGPKKKADGHSLVKRQIERWNKAQ